MPSYAFPVAPPSPYTGKAANKPYVDRRTQLRSTFSNQEPSQEYNIVAGLDGTNVQLGAKTKKSITFLRRAQLGLRIAQLSGAIGLLVCTACTTNLQEQQNFTLYTPPSIDVLVTGYAISHLLRSATHRPATASSNYHFFASTFDICLIPFYIFITVLARSEILTSNTDSERWTSIFEPGQATDRLILAIWLFTISIAALHGVTLLISGYLFFIFKQISHLPPDMNPLEAHLTSRPHKTRTLRSYEIRETESHDRPFSFFRAQSNITKNSARLGTAKATTAARLDLALPALPVLANTTNERGLGTQSMSKRSYNSSINFSSIRSILQGSSRHSLNLYEEFMAPPLPRRSSKRRSEVPSDGLSTRDVSPQRDENSDARFSAVEEEVGQEETMYRSQAVEFDHRNQHRTNFYEPIPQMAPVSRDVYVQSSWPRSYNASMLQPLNMNPPTPPPTTTIMTEPLCGTSPNIPPRSPSRKPKGRCYGELTPRASGDLGIPDSIPTNNTPWYSPVKSSLRHQQDTGTRMISHSGVDIGEVGTLAQQYVSSHDLDTDQIHDGASDASSGLAYKGASGVVLSGLRERNVSGKVMEEGRSGCVDGKAGEMRISSGALDAHAENRSWSGRWFGGR